MTTELTIAYLADAGEAGALQTSIAELIGSWSDVDYIFAAGDMTGYVAGQTAAQTWAAFTALGIPIYPVLGNHESYDNAHPTEDETATLALFPHLPANGEGHSRYWSVELGDGLLRLDGWHSDEDHASFTDGIATGSTQYNYFEGLRDGSPAWWTMAMSHWPSEDRVANTKHKTELAHLADDKAYDLVLYGHTHANREFLQAGGWALNVSTGRTSRALEASEGETVVETFADTSQRNCVTRIRVTSAAMLWEIFDVATGQVIHTGGTGARKGRTAAVALAPLSLPESEGGGRREHSYKDVLWSAAKRRGLLPEQDGLQVSDAIQLTDFLNESLRFAWTYYTWPETVTDREKILPETGGDGRRYIPWLQQTYEDGWRRIGAVLEVCNTASTPRSLDYDLTPDGIVIKSKLGATDSVLVTWRSLPPEFTHATHSTTAAYAEGALVYDPTSGDGFRAYDAVSAGEALAGSRKWERLPIPWVLGPAVKAGVEALFLRAENQFDSEQVLEVAMVNLLDHEIGNLQVQQQQTLRYRRHQ